MASIVLERLIAIEAAGAWAALRDFGALHTRLAPDFVADTTLDEDARIVTFVNGLVVRERLVDLDDERRRLVWSAQGDPFVHHNGAAQVLEAGPGHCRFVWTADLLPDALAEQIRPMMEEGLRCIQAHLETTAVRA